MNRRSFINQAGMAGAAFSIFSNIEIFNALNTSSNSNQASKDLKLSLAEWSLHRQFFEGNLNSLEFASISKNTYGISAVEYVNQFYVYYAKNEKFWLGMKDRADDIGVKSLLIMVDDEGDLGVKNKRNRKKAVENHFKWVDAAKLLGCHSIRVNAFGNKSKETFKEAIIDGMGKLSEYAEKENINIIIENHGLFSSDGKLIVDIIKQVNKPNFGTFPDFGNWCTSAKWGSTQGECDEVYDRYQGVAEFLPYAKAVSAKSYNFNEEGEDIIIDYHKMLKLVKDSSYNGHIGIEYEGNILSEHEGILATKKLIERVWSSL